MLFKYTLKNTVHWELNHQAAPNYRANETITYICRTHFIQRTPKALYKWIREHTLRNQLTHNWNTSATGARLGSFLAKGRNAALGQCKASPDLTKHTLASAAVTQSCAFIIKKGLEMKSTRKLHWDHSP
jgi:hypothetical protein